MEACDRKWLDLVSRGSFPPSPLSGCQPELMKRPNSTNSSLEEDDLFIRFLCCIARDNEIVCFKIVGKPRIGAA